MNKKTIFKKLLQISLISLLSIQSACVFSTNCYKVGYSQEIDGTFFDEKESNGYFIYSYLDKKDSKSYFLYSIDLNGKAEKLADLGSKPYDSKKTKNTLSYKFHVLPNDKIFLEESNFTGIRDHYFYLVDLKNKSIIYDLLWF